MHDTKGLDGQEPAVPLDARASSIELFRRLDFIQERALSLYNRTELPAVLKAIVELAREFTAAAYGALGVAPGQQDQPFDPWVVSGMPPCVAERIGHPPRPVGVLGAVIQEGHSLRLEDISRDPRFRGLPPEHPPIGAFLGAPLRGEEGCVGHLYVANRPGERAFSETDQWMLEFFARQAAAATEHIRNREHLEQEIIERKKMEEALRRGEARMALAQRLVRLGHVEIDLRTNEWFWSEEALRIFGRDPAEVPPGLEEAAQLLIHPADLANFWQKLDLALAGEGPLEMEYRILRPDGEVRHLHTATEVRPDEQGTPAYLFGTVEDVSAQKRAEEERDELFQRIRIKRRWLSAVIENAPVGIILVEGPGGDGITVNRRAVALFGRTLPPGEALDSYLEQIFHPDGRPLEREERPALRALRGEQVTDMELLIRQPDGHEVPVLVRAASIQGVLGTQLGAILTYEDLTTVRELQRVREEWTSLIAHDLRQPVSAIYMLAQLLSFGTGVDPAVLKQRAEHILASAKQLNRMINDLLDVSRIEARNLDLTLEPVDLKELLPAVLERSVGYTQGHRVQFETDGDIPRLQLDPGRLEQVLANLLSNAAKYGAPGTPIQVRLERGADCVHVSVTNRGEGIPAEELPKLFIRFSRTRKALQARKSGLGLGLYITRGLIEAHGGRIWAESTPGLTTTFHFTLPIPA